MDETEVHHKKIICAIYRKMEQKETFLKHEFQEMLLMLVWEMLDIRLGLEVRLFKCKET